MCTRAHVNMPRQLRAAALRAVRQSDRRYSRPVGPFNDRYGVRRVSEHQHTIEYSTSWLKTARPARGGGLPRRQRHLHRLHVLRPKSSSSL